MGDGREKIARMMSMTEARELAVALAAKATAGGPTDWQSGSGDLESLDGRTWLLVDQAARTFTYADGTPVSGVRGWLSTTVDEPTGFVAAVTSLHVDGRIRERATQILTTKSPVVATRALGLRLLDHVPQVRAAAWAGVRQRLDLDTVADILEVLLAGRNRQHAAQALVDVEEAVLAEASPNDLVSMLAASTRRDVRRWAFSLGHKRKLLTADQLLDSARNDPDQWLRAMCADWLMAEAEPHRLVALLDANSVEARLVALTRVSDTDLSDDALGALLTDRAPRVREQARWRAHRRNLDIPAFYRDKLTQPVIPPRVCSACLDGLALVGDESDLPACVAHLDHQSARVRAAAVNAVLGRARDEDVVELLIPVLLDPSPRVSATAARALARVGVPPSAAAAAWSSAQPASRRAAWRLSRASGGWHRVEADLRAATDADTHLASLGHAGISNWLAVGAATTWAHLPDEQRQRIEDLLPGADLGDNQQRVVAFHAGIKPLPAVTPPDDNTSAPPVARRPRWLRLIRRD